MPEDKPPICPDASGQFSVTTPIGSFSSRGKKSAELIAALSLAALLVIGYALWRHEEETVRARESRSKQIELLTAAINNMASAQREMTCMISLSQDKRELEYQSPVGRCKRIGAMQ
jgi:hypothetical protein